MGKWIVNVIVCSLAGYGLLFLGPIFGGVIAFGLVMGSLLFIIGDLVRTKKEVDHLAKTVRGVERRVNYLIEIYEQEEKQAQ
ncbi:hypothetical protein ACI7RC_00045 [Brevibacillus sp. B_LB10_24]|uniref:hypothetical protein n=1 Tax=Brevibacillus sp. B_LB10_24 TaxID=3380645 RepID=UPI0038BBA283